MDQIKKIVHECHRRSLWQVLAIYLVGSWGALQAIQGVTQTAGLPDWVPPGALILFMIGLPIVLATAFVQEGMGGAARTTEGRIEIAEGSQQVSFAPAPQPPSTHRLLTWRRAIVGGVVAFGVLAGSVGVYALIWSKGNLVAQGVLEERERIMLADFANATTDSLVDDVVTEALRVDLAESKTITLVEPAFVQQVLQRMGRPADERFTAELAREAAVREGINALIEGEIGAAGSGFVLTARLVAAADGTVLASFRETARDGDGILDAIDGLSQAIRNKAGESLSDIREAGALEQVTTGSLEALRRYTQAEAVTNEGDSERAITLLEEALALDSTFAMAWRKLAVLRSNTGKPVAQRVEAATRAYELRDRLTPRERDQATAYYYYSPVAEQDVERAAQVYEGILDEYPDDRAALNNLAVIRNSQDDLAGAAVLLERAVNGPGESAAAHGNLIGTLYGLGRLEEARTALARFNERYPANLDAENQSFLLAFYERRWAEADSLTRAIATEDRTRTANSHFRRAMIHVAQGRLSEAAPHFRAQSDVSPTEAYNSALNQARIQMLWPEDRGAARGLVESVLARHPIDEITPPGDRRFQVAEVYARMGDARQMESWLARDASARPNAPQQPAYQGRREAVYGHLALASGDFAGAEARYREARRLEDNARAYQPELGLALLRSGKHEEALKELEAWAADRRLRQIFYPTMGEPLVQERLGETYEALGRRAEAAAAYEKLAELWKDADAVLQPRVQRAREKAAALRAAGL
jgi:eukaryotic-like serine/threonine-protein kinase